MTVTASTDAVTGHRPRPHLIYVTAGFPFPLTSGYLRHHFLVGRLAARYDITLMSLVGGSFCAAHADALSTVTRTVRTFGPPATGKAVRVASRTRQLSLAPGDATIGALRDAVGEEIAGGKVDAVLLSGKRTVPVLDRVGDTPLVVDLCDATSSRLRGEARHARPARAVDLRLQEAVMRRVERALITRADRLLVASERDRDLLAVSAGTALADRVRKAVVVTNGIDLDIWSRRQPTLGTTVAFCGNLGYPPNEDAALRLIVHVMPLVWAARPATEVVIIGRNPSRQLSEAAADARVRITGEVPDVRPHLEDAAVFVAPLRHGAGIQNKVLEAMALEMPVVTTSLAAGGLRTAGQDPPVAVADHSEAMAAQVIARLDAVAADPTPDAAARRWVGERFVWANSGDRVANALAGAIAERSTTC